MQEKIKILFKKEKCSEVEFFGGKLSFFFDWRGELYIRNNKGFSHWTWKIRKIPIIGQMWYQVGNGKTNRRTFGIACQCFWDWRVKPFLKKFLCK